MHESAMMEAFNIERDQSFAFRINNLLSRSLIFRDKQFKHTMKAPKSLGHDQSFKSPAGGKLAARQECQTLDRHCLGFHLTTLWLFTRSDLNSMIYPNVILGLASAMSGPVLTTNQIPDAFQIMVNTPYIVLWLWLNLLLFNIANQRLPSAILEDTINKPWRPLPAKRLDSNQARLILLVTIPLVVLFSLRLGATAQVLLLVALTWMYNDLGGADENFWTRNILNALGMACYSSGAIIVACGNECALTRTGYQWIALIGLTVMTTIQMQDLSDQDGDATRGRKTLPLVLGNGFARWTIGGSVTAWSVAAPAFWDVGIKAYVPPFAVGSVLTARVFLLRTVDADKGTWKLWCVWMISLYLLPLWSHRFRDSSAAMTLS